MLARILAIALTAAVSSMSHADETYNLRGPSPEKGQIYILTAKSTGKDVARKISVSGKVISDEKFNELLEKKKEVEVLGVADGEITRMRTKIVLDQRDEIFKKGKREIKKSAERDMQGQIVYSERGPKGWKNSLEDVTPTDKQKQELKDYVPFKEEDIFYPKEPVKIGHTWKLDPKDFERVMGHQFEDFKGTGTGKFIRVEKKDGEDLAIIELEFELAGKSKEDDLTMDVKISGKGTVERSLKHGFDRKSTTTVQMEMKGGGETDGQKIEVEYKGNMNAEDLIELKAKK